MRVSITRVATLVDVPRATCVRLDAVSYYVGFVGLARVRMATGFAGVPTILNLFSAHGGGGEPAGDVTAWDLAYLSGLYRAPASRPARVRRSLIGGGMLKGLRDRP